MSDIHQLAVIGGGPAGLRAAEVAAQHGAEVILLDAKPSVGRKFLIAGKGGLNLTHGEDFQRFTRRYSGPDFPSETWKEMLAEFDATALRAWAAGLGVETFQASSGRIYPREMKAAPLLRRWIARLKGLGVQFVMNRRWCGLRPGAPNLLEFTDGSQLATRAVVFALGGGSWPQTGSDGGWLSAFQELGISCAPLAPANCGWEHPWPDEVLSTAEGQPIKNIRVSAGGVEVAGELLVTRYGLEGGAIYQLGASLRAMEQPAIAIDFKPDFSHDELMRKMESVRKNPAAEIRTRWRLGGAAAAILSSRGCTDVAELARAAKHCVIEFTGPRPLSEAISSAGGVCWSELDGSLMLKRLPGVFVAGEMIDWEAPTGGYLMQGCFASGTRAGQAAADWLR